MKILLINSIEEKDSAGRLKTIFGKMNIHVENCPLAETEDNNSLDAFSKIEAFRRTHIASKFVDYFSIINPETEEEPVTVTRTENPTHVVILSPLSGRWFDFLAGFYFGSHVAFLVYGSKAMGSIPGELASFFAVLETEDSLQNYFDNEKEIFKKYETANQIRIIRESLLKMGVPVNEESFADCVAKDSTREVTLFLAAGFSPDTRDKAGVPVLNISARMGNRAMLQLLIQSGAMLNQRADDRGTSALMDSTLGNYKDIVMDLVEAGADPNIQSKDKQSALIVAVGNGNEEIIEILLKAGSDPDVLDSLGMSARKYVSLFNKKSIVALFDKYAPRKPG